MLRHDLDEQDMSPDMYGTHSFRRGGAQWAMQVEKWPIMDICQHGGWSYTEQTSMIKYVIGANDINMPKNRYNGY